MICVVISLLVLVCLLTERDAQSTLKRIFFGFTLCNIGVISTDVVAWFMTGNTQSYAFYLIRVANFLHYSFGALILASMTFYIFAYLELKIKIPVKLKTTVLLICIISLIVISR